MPELAEMKCVPCRGGAPQVTDTEMKAYLPQIPEWQVVEVDGEKHLTRTYKLKKFSGALAFTNLVGKLAEEQDHHPQIVLEWGRVTVSWWTHAIGGLHRNDFVMAAQCDELYSRQMN